MERYYTTQRPQTYVGAALPNSECMTDLAAHYTIQLSGAATASTYTVQAVPQGRQASKDTECGTMSIDQTGAKTVSGTGSSSECF
ncbi:hypothetical protein D3C73_1574790 [compost metagenome]